jgi:hypothetical protein
MSGRDKYICFITGTFARKIAAATKAIVSRCSSSRSSQRVIDTISHAIIAVAKTDGSLNVHSSQRGDSLSTAASSQLYIGGFVAGSRSMSRGQIQLPFSATSALPAIVFG